MTAQSVATALDVGALVHAIESRDAEGQLAAYGDDAELVVVDHEHPPSNPRTVRGTVELRAYLADICARDMTHEVKTAALAGDRLILEVACRYADGTRVSCLCVGGIVDGRIAWSRGLQAWDH
jgi:hypothetical protein